MLALCALKPASAEELRFAGNPAGAPFTYLDAADNVMKGICIDVLAEMGVLAGFEVVAAPVPVADQLTALNANAADVLCAQISPARLEQAAFTDPIHTYGEGLFVRVDDPATYTIWEDLRGQAVGATAGTPWLSAMQQSGIFSEVRVFPVLADVMAAVAAGELKGGFAAAPIVIYQINEQGMQPALRVPLPFEARVVAPNSSSV